jgi:hypothetical protein
MPSDRPSPAAALIDHPKSPASRRVDPQFGASAPRTEAVLGTGNDAHSRKCVVRTGQTPANLGREPDPKTGRSH